eukprot:1485458-Heterocapsa_arctica.AAC.1
MASILFALRRGREASSAMTVQWLANARKLKESTGALHSLIEQGAPKWKWRSVSAGHLTMGDDFAAAVLRDWAAEAWREAWQRGRDASSAASDSWRAWVDEQLQAGAGALHRLTKREGIVADEA